MIEIIVVKYNYPDIEKDCINSVIKHTNINYHLTIYDNYPNNENIGLLWNKLINRSDAEYVCLLNSDTVVTDGWLEKMHEIVQSGKMHTLPTEDHRAF